MPVTSHKGVVLEEATLPVPEDGSCSAHKTHGSIHPLLLQGHHIFPQEWQIDLVGAVTIDQEKDPLCGTGHDSVHALLRPVYRELPGWQYATEEEAAERATKIFRDMVAPNRMPHELHLAEEAVRRYARYRIANP